MVNSIVLLLFLFFQGYGSRQNFAVEKTARQSSVNSGGEASRAVDGDTNDDFAHGSCSHTDDNAGQWWEVDLYGLYQIDEIIIYNRGDCCGNLLHNFTIDLYLNDRLKFQDEKPIVCATYLGTVDSSVTIKCQPDARGRFLKISLIERGALAMCEVQVYGEAAAKAGIQLEPENHSGWIGTYNVDEATLIACGKLCLNFNTCFNFFYNVESKKCEPKNMYYEGTRTEPWVYFKMVRLLSISYC